MYCLQNLREHALSELQLLRSKTELAPWEVLCSEAPPCKQDSPGSHWNAATTTVTGIPKT